MGKGSNAQKKASVRERKRKEMEGKGEGGGGKEGLEKRTGQLAQKILCKICKVLIIFVLLLDFIFMYSIKSTTTRTFRC